MFLTVGYREEREIGESSGAFESIPSVPDCEFACVWTGLELYGVAVKFVASAPFYNGI